MSITYTKFITAHTGRGFIMSDGLNNATSATRGHLQGENMLMFQAITSSSEKACTVQLLSRNLNHLWLDSLKKVL